MTTAPYKIERPVATCHWCKKEFNPSGHNLAHVGGQGDVYGCNYCLSLKDKNLIDLTQKLFNEAGYSGNVYKADPKLLRRFENQAIEIEEGE